MVFCWGNPENARLGGVDPERHHTPQENMRLTSFKVKKKVEVRKLLRNVWRPFDSAD